MITAKKQIPPGQNRKGLRWFFLIMLIAAELILNAWIRSESSQAMQQISQSRTQIRDLTEYRAALNVERERLKSEGRIIRLAHSRLGMVTETLSQTIYLPKGYN